MSRSSLILTTSPLSQPTKNPCGTASLPRRLRPVYGRKRYYHTVKERDSETGLHYYGARYLDSKTGRWISGDPAVGEYIPSAPADDEARKRNQSLPGMGGVFNYVNLHVYHYAGNNPVKLFDPDGENIYNFTIISIGAKAVIGGGVSFGIAFDDNGNFAALTNLSVGMGIDVSAAIAITFSISKDVNLSDLPSFGPYRFDTGVSVSGALIAGIIHDLGTNEIVGGIFGPTVTAGVDGNLTIYFDFNKATEIFNSWSDETKQQFFKVAETMKNNLPEDVYAILQNLFSGSE